MAKHLIPYLLGISTLLLCHCDSSSFIIDHNNGLNFPESSKKFGESIANELEKSIRSLHMAGVDYSHIVDADELRISLYKDLHTNRPEIFKTKSTNIELPFESQDFIKQLNTLTRIQIDYINRIIRECGSSLTYRDLYENLKNINKDILKNIPDIQQERLFNVTSFLYHSMKILEDLESQGIVIPTSANNTNQLSTKSYIGDNCRKVIAATWAAALAEPSPFGEAIAFATTLMISGMILYEIIVCPTDYSYCQSLYENCYSDIPDGCSICLQFCLTNGYWPPYGSHRCSYPEPIHY